MNSKELFAMKDLSGFRITVGYFAQIKHSLMGMFPALVTTEDGVKEKQSQIAFCIERETLRAILMRLPPEDFRITKMLVLADEERKIAFSLKALDENWSINRNTENLQILTLEDVQKRQEFDTFTWAIGLLSSKESPIKKEYMRMIESALAEI